MTDADKLAAEILDSGLSARQFAVRVMSRDERTVRRWLAGEEMPPTVRAWLDSLERVTVTSRSIGIRLKR